MATQSSKTIESVWVSDDENVFEIGTVIHDHIVKDGSTDKYCIVTVQRENGPEKREYKRSLVYEVDKTHLQDLDDLIEMNSLHEAPLLDILRRRWLQDTMYTFTGEFLVSINPYKTLVGQNDNPLQYLDLTPKKKDAKVTPHVFAVSNFALREASKPVVEDEPASVSIIITGESGAGKTEASKQVLNFLTLANKASFPSDVELADSVKNVIIDSNAIFEAFGNAKTVRNDNSSRFGKYIKLEYTADNQLWSAHTETFLLEKSRLVSVGTDDRNYHIFYQMVRGLDVVSKGKLHLTRVEDFKILTSGGCTVITTEEEDITEFVAVCKALNLMGCTAADIDRLWELLSCVLHLGNIIVTPADTKKEQLQLTSIALEELANFLGVDIDGFVTALTMQKVNVKQTGEVYDKILSDEDIRNNIGALIKWVYGGVFNWIVAKVNSAYSTFSTSADKAVVKFIGVLDIFGFEIFVNNTFEQLCINYTNERLQQQFNEVVFEAEQEEYRREGLDWTSISFRDNQGVIDMIGKRPKGLLIILEEHSLMNRDPDDLALLNSFNKLHATAPAMNPFYGKSRFGNDGFIVKHFAGEVSYNISNFIAKNNDSLQEDLTILFSTSSNSFLLEILRNSEVNAGKDKTVDAGTKIASSVSVSYRFRNQLDSLVNTLRSTKPFYIKCIKPNSEKKANMFDSNLVVTQLRYSGILEIVRIRREGYPTRITYFDFYVEFRELAVGKKWIKPQDCDPGQLKEYCRMLCQQFIKTKESYQFGKTFLFLHHYVPGIMNYEVYKAKVRCAIKIQNQMRKLRAMKKLNESKNAAVKMQSLARVILAKKAKNILHAEKVQKEEVERQRIETERLAREEEERRLAEEVRIRRAEQAADEENRRVQATKIQKVMRGRKPKLTFIKHMKLIRRLQAVMKKFSRDLRNKALITSFHDTCKTATSSMIPLLRQTLSANPQVYRNKWSSYCTFYQSLLLGGRSEVLTGFTITPKLILEKDIDGATLLPYAVSNPNMAFLKTLAKIITDVKSSDATMPDDDEGEDEAEDRGSIVSPTSPALIDVFTGLTIIKAGWVKKLGSKFGFKYYKKRYAVLTEEYIVFYRAVNKRPAGCIPIDGAVITRLSGSEPIISIKLPDSTVVDKKKQLKHTVYTLKLENEADVQDWQTPMKLAAGVRPFRETPINYINLNIRAAWCELVDKRGRTALHALAAISSDLHLAKEEEAIMTAAWLLENGCSVEARDVDKRTPIIVALDSKFSALQAFLLRRKQSIDALDPRNPSRISISALGLAQLESRKSIVKEPHQLLQTMKLKGFSYLQIYIQKFRQVIPRIAFDAYVNPRLHINVLNAQRQQVEPEQTIDSPAIVTKDYFFWGYTWYMQTPLENIGDGFTIEVELMHGPTATPPRVAAISVYKIDKVTIDSGFCNLQFTNLSGEEIVKKSAAPVIKSMSSDSSLDCEFEITKFHRDVKLQSLA